MNGGDGKLYELRHRDVVLVLAIGLAQVVTLVLFIVLLKSVVNALTPLNVGAAAAAQQATALINVFWLTVVAITHGSLRALEFNITEAIGYRIVRQLRMSMYGHLQGMTPRQFQGRARGGLLLRFLGDLSMTRLWISRGVLCGLVAAVVLSGTLVVMAVLNLWMTLAAVAAISLGAAVSLGAGWRMRRATRTMRRRRSLVMSNIDEQMNAQAVVQVFGRARGEFNRLSHQNDNLTRALIRVATLRGYLRGVSVAFSMLAACAVLVAGLFEVRRGTTSVGMVVAFVVVVRQLAGPVRQLGLAHDYWHRAQVSLGKIGEFMRSSSRELDAPGSHPLRVNKGAIDFMNVSVAGALSGIELRIEPGQFVAVTGPGGAGKSTLLGILSRTVEPDAGSVVIDGQLLSRTTLMSSARWIGAMGPDLPLMRGTVQRNLTYATPNAYAHEVARLLHASGLDQLLAELPDGLESWVTEGGLNLSHSQRQRIALGRALMGNPPILVLDEPSNGMDALAKDALVQLLVRHKGTILLASHEPDELALADQVVVMEGGRIRQVLSGEAYRDQHWLATQLGRRP